MSNVNTLIKGAAIFACIAISNTSISQTKKELDQCAGITDSRARLECFDKLISSPPEASSHQQMEKMPPKSSPKEQKAQPERTKQAADKETSADRNDFGKESMNSKKQRAIEDKQKQEQLVAKVASVRLSADRATIVELDNGQTWVEISATGSNAPRAGDTVTLKTALFGSYFLTGDFGAPLRVKRIR